MEELQLVTIHGEPRILKKKHGQKHLLLVCAGALHFVVTAVLFLLLTDKSGLICLCVCVCRITEC